MTHRQTLNQINTNLKAARANRDIIAADKWQIIRWMADRASMKTWTIGQLEAQHSKTLVEHNITIEVIA